MGQQKVDGKNGNRMLKRLCKDYMKISRRSPDHFNDCIVLSVKNDFGHKLRLERDWEQEKERPTMKVTAG